MNDTKLFRSTLLLIAFHLIGLIGMLGPWKETFQLLTPVNLVASTYFLFRHQPEFSKKAWFFFVLCFVLGFFAEVAGVKTGKIFGIYSYGRSLGPKLFDVPLTMGLNWLCLVYSAGCLFAGSRMHWLIRSTLGASILVLLDTFIEPIAIRSDFWNWEHGIIPIQNFVAWWVISFLILIMFHLLSFNKANPLVKAFLIIQFVFFILLNIF